MATRPKAPPEVLKEYELCHDRAAKLGDRVWTTASLFGAGSVAGILAISATPLPERIRPWIVISLTVFAIALLVSWRRIVGRWWSIEHAFLRRMEHIERQFQMRATLYVARLDKRVSFEHSAVRATLRRPFLPQDLDADLEAMQSVHQREGLVAVADFVVEVGIAVWLAFAATSLLPLLRHALGYGPGGPFGGVVAGLLIAWFIWRLLAMKGRP